MTAETETGNDENGRAKYLIDGRRVRVSDLLDAGLLQPGARLRFARNRIGSTHYATVTEKGRIRLAPGGEEFRSPSGAAMVAAGMRAVDGWRAWTVVEQNRLLDAARQELLEQTMSGSRRKDADTVRRNVHERLLKARQRAEENDPERVSVRELLAFWGATDRGDQAAQIEADLANHGLRTAPGFRAVTLDTTVALTTPPDDGEENAGTSESGDVQVADNDEGDDDLNVRLTVGNLSPLRGVESVDPNSPLVEAITKLSLNDFSQLAVLGGPRNARGAVTWRSIALALQQNPDAGVADALDPHVELVAYDRDLFDILPVLQERDFVFVLDETRAIKGIVTTADVAHRYGEMATPFFQVGELDQTLRQILSRTFDIDTVRSICKKPISSFDRLTMGDSQRVLENKEMWEKLSWRLDRTTFIARLEEIRHIRNKVMHFHSDPIPEDAVQKLRNFNKLLREHRGLTERS